MDKRTAYRTIHTFKSTGTITHAGPGLIELAPPFRQTHGYVVCRGCGRRAAFWDEVMEKRIHLILARRRYIEPAYQLEITGLCSLCTEKSR